LLLKSVNPNNKAPRNKTRNTKNKILATEAAPAAIPVKPKMAAIIAMTKKIAEYFNMLSYFNV